MGPYELLGEPAKILDHRGISCLVTGSVAAMACGELRLTNGHAYKSWLPRPAGDRGLCRLSRRRGTIRGVVPAVPGRKGKKAGVGRGMRILGEDTQGTIAARCGYMSMSRCN